MKIIVGIVIVGIGALAFFAPWHWIDNGEDIKENRFFQGNDAQNFKKPKASCNCDGSCLNVKWVPFGAKVDACSEDYYFISFWGQKFYREGVNSQKP